MDSEELIRKELQLLLSEPNLDYNRILALSNNLAKCDPKNVRFSVDAELINRLGNELVARQETALSELIKNAYDADATKVILRFIDTDHEGGTLVIEDNGVGMDRDQIINGFMRISSNMKVERPMSEIYHRIKAGRKGIGRFAVQRLGERLEILTKTSTASQSYDVLFDWSDYKASRDLSEISNEIRLAEKHVNESGTKLIISDMRDKWSTSAIMRIYRYLEDILQPVPEFNDGNKTNPFELEVYKEQNGKSEKIENLVTQVDQYSVATIWAEIDEQGLASFRIDSKQLGFKLVERIGYNPDNVMTAFPLIKNVRIKAYYFLDNYLPKNQKTAIQQFLRLSGSIRLYRNGYRVLPYGEPTNDWLKLDYSLRQRSLLPQHGNNNFRGIVNIDNTSGEFEETSSREGLVENDSFIQLQNFVYRTLLTAVVRIAKVRNVKITTSQKKEDGYWQDIDVKIKNIAYSVDELDKVIGNNLTGAVEVKNTKKIFNKLKREISDLGKEAKEEKKKIKEERTMLRILSSVGLSTEQFVHEIKYYLGAIKRDVTFLKERYLNDKEGEERLNILSSNFSNFQTYVSYFDAMVANNVNRQLVPVEMRRVIEDFVKAMSQDASNSGIVIEEPDFYSYNLYTEPMHPSEWSSILFNFYTNSKKAIKRSQQQPGRIKIEAGKENGNIYLEFSDNGDGIPSGNEEIIFERFYTTSDPLSLDDVNMANNVTGSGLGLTIVKDIVVSNKGSVKVVPPKGIFRTCLRVEIPALSEKEIIKLL